MTAIVIEKNIMVPMRDGVRLCGGQISHPPGFFPHAAHW